MKNNLHLAVALSIVLALFAIALYFFRPVTTNNLTRVTVAGEAAAQVAPDSGVITFSVVTQNQQAVNAQQENARKSEAVIKAVEAIAANAEIKTSNYSLQPEQSYRGDKMPSIIGYEARNSVTVTISDLNAVGAVIDAATKAGANSVEGVAFVLRKDSPAHGDALAVATRQAMAKAESVAQSLGGRIVRVVETLEGSVPVPQPITNYGYLGAGNMNATGANRSYMTPVEVGSLNVRSQVVLVVEIEVKK